MCGIETVHTWKDILIYEIMHIIWSWSRVSHDYIYIYIQYNTDANAGRQLVQWTNSYTWTSYKYSWFYQQRQPLLLVTKRQFLSKLFEFYSVEFDSTLFNILLRDEKWNKWKENAGRVSAVANAIDNMVRYPKLRCKLQLKLPCV
jgi:hypothetical protein